MLSIWAWHCSIGGQLLQKEAPRLTLGRDIWYWTLERTEPLTLEIPVWNVVVALSSWIGPWLSSSCCSKCYCTKTVLLVCFYFKDIPCALHGHWVRMFSFQRYSLALHGPLIHHAVLMLLSRVQTLVTQMLMRSG